MTITKRNNQWGNRLFSDKTPEPEQKKETVEDFFKRGGEIEKLDYEDDYLEDLISSKYYTVFKKLG